MANPASDERAARRVADLMSSDMQFAAAAPDPAVAEELARPGLRLPEVVRILMTSYADRPALGQRAVREVTDAQTGRTTLELLPSFQTITYRQLLTMVQRLTTAWHTDTVAPGDRVAILGFNSVDYMVVDTTLTQLGAVSVPLQTSAPLTQLRPIVTETEPTVIASSIDFLSDAVELALTGHAPKHIMVFDYHPVVDDQRETFEAAANRLAEAEGEVIIETLENLLASCAFDAAVEAAAGDPIAPVIRDEDDPLYLLIYTSGSTGTPKGVMCPESQLVRMWGTSALSDWEDPVNRTPAITLNFMPMSHVLGRAILTGTLHGGGTAYFAARSDLSTLLDDMALVRPTQLSFVPRIWEILFQDYQSRLEHHAAGGADRASAATEALEEIRHTVLGGRYVSAITGSAPISRELLAWVEKLLDIHVTEGYGATESGVLCIDGQLNRPQVIDYKLVDVPDLGYFRTDRPHPRGELLVKTEWMFPGYYKRPEITAACFDEDGYYRTGDIVAELGCDQLRYLDRRNNVLKLSQGEFVTISKVESAFDTSPLIGQIYIYGNSARSYLLAVIVPTGDTLAKYVGSELKAVLRTALQTAACAAGLQSYEIPRDFIVETTPFTLENGLLTGIRKLARPKLKERYGEELEQLYAQLAEGQKNELRTLLEGGANGPALKTICRAAGAMLGAAATDLQADTHFTDLGGDSLSALTFANLLQDIFDVEIPVGVIVSPASNLQGLADYVEAERLGIKRPTFHSVHRRSDGPITQVLARDLTIDKFVDTATLTAAPSLPPPRSEVGTVLLTGATGFLGRYLALEWLERTNLADGKLICLVRAKDDAAARIRLDATFDSNDPTLSTRYRRLAADHLEVIAGDKTEPNLGLDQQTWQRLADTVDLIVDPAALVNHVLPYSQLFSPNVVGTAELIRIALTTRQKPFVYVSTVGVGSGIEPGKFTEDGDVRKLSATRTVDDNPATGYANGYSNSKWAAEVLLRQANDLCGLPTAVFRCDMIMADTTYAGQLNVPDMFTRLMLSLIATGIAPGSFYELDADGNRQRAHFDGLPVEFIAEAISTLGERMGTGCDSDPSFKTYHVMNPHDDGVGLDEFVDWLVAAGYPIDRISDYAAWLQRFETTMRALPEKQRQASLLPLLHNYKLPQPPICGSIAPANRFRAAVQDAKVGHDKDIPHVTPEMIVKYAEDLQLLGLL